MRYLLFSLFLLFSGCSSKICGIEERAFKNFPPHKQEEICETYAKAVGEAELLRQKRLLLAEENRKKELELELKKVRCLYAPKPDDPYAATQILQIRIVSGEVIDEGMSHSVVPLEFTLARREMRKVCFDGHCFWITYQGGVLLVNVEPDWEKERFGRYVAKEGDYYVTKQTRRVIPHDWFRGEYTWVWFQKGKRKFRLRLFIRYYQ